MMDRLVTDEFEMPGKATAAKHVKGIAADAKRLTCRNDVMLVENELLRVMRDRTPVDDMLAEILAGRLERR